MRQTLRNLGALPLALIAIVILVGLMKALISPRAEETAQESSLPSVVYLVEAIDAEAEPAPQPVVEPERPEPEPEPPEPPEPLEPEPLPEELELPLDQRPLDLPLVEKPPEKKPKPKPKPKPQVSKKPVSKPAVAKKTPPAKFNGRATYQPRPRYPTNAKRRGIEGDVTLRFTVTRKGDVSNPQVIAATPSGVFEQEALKAVRRWRYPPQQTDGTVATVKIRFVLKEYGY